MMFVGGIGGNPRVGRVIRTDEERMKTRTVCRVVGPGWKKED
jgi:hypothetical protein